MRVLVTGGAGFIGSHLVDRLVGDGHAVICVDDLSTGRADWLPSGVRLIAHDVTEPLPDLEIDRVYHLACPGAPVAWQRDPVRTVLINVLGARHVLELARRRGARALLASTSEVYGDPRQHPQGEAYRGHVDPTGPRACYDEGKRVAETLFTEYRRQHGVDTRIARLFNTYGPRMAVDDGRVIPNFVVQALRGEPLTLHGDGTQTRSFCHVDDIVEGLVRLMEHPHLVAPVNLGHPDERSIRDLAAMVLELAGSRAGLARHPRPADDPGRRCPDLARAREELGWRPRIPLHEGLRATLEWLRDHLGGDPLAGTLGSAQEAP